MSHKYECSHCGYSYTEPSEEPHFSIILCDDCRNSKGKEWDRRKKGIYGSKEVDEYFKRERRAKMLRPWKWF